MSSYFIPNIASIGSGLAAAETRSHRPRATAGDLTVA
jgi:hypothetical protein